MPSPDISGLTYDPFLTQISVGAFLSDDQFAAHRAFPMLQVMSPSGIITGWKKEDLLRDEMRRRLPGARYGRVGAGTTQLRYTVEEFGLEWTVDKLVKAKAMRPYDLEVVAARGLTQKALIHIERAWLSAFFTTGIWTGSSTGTDLVGGTDFTQWDDLAAEPVKLIKREKRAMQLLAGPPPNTLVLGQKVYDDLTESPDLQDRLGANAEKSVALAELARFFDIDRVVVASGIYNAAQEGLAFSGQYMAGNHAWLGYAAPAPAENQLSAGYTVVWSGWIPGGDVMSPITSYEEIQTNTDVYRIDMGYDLIQVSPECGVFFSNAVAA